MAQASPPGGRVKNGVWRLLRLFVAAIVNAVIPKPDTKHCTPSPETFNATSANHREVRRIYLDVPHSVDAKPSWFGESVGHYENGELVVGTVGLSTSMNSISWTIGAPRTPKTHAQSILYRGKWRRALAMSSSVGAP